MHMRGEPADMAAHAHYDDVVAEVCSYLVERAERAAAAGVHEVYIDPGIGFAKNAAYNLTLLAHLDVMVATGWPVVVGTSRKSFLGRLTGGTDSLAGGTAVAPVDDRLEGSLATSAWAMTQGVSMVRVHDVAPAVYAARLMDDRAERAQQ